MGRRNQNQQLDQTGPATRYSNRAGAYADDSDQGDNRSERHCLDARNDWAAGTATYGTPRGANKSHR